MKNLRVVGALVALFLLAGAVKGQSSAPKVLLDIPALVLKTPEQVEKVVGKARYKETTTSPEYSPGEIRTYDFKKVDGSLNVRYRYGTAVSISVDFYEKSPYRKDPEAIPELFGFDPSEMKIVHRNQFAIRWVGPHRGIDWKQVQILTSNGEAVNLNTIVREVN